MTRIQVLLLLLMFGAMTAYSSVSISGEAPKVKGVKAGVIEAVPLNRSQTYCHLRFPAIDPKTLATKTPKLQDAKTGEIIDFYGPCDHDPLGFDEVCKQKIQQSAREGKEYCD
jgi:hypothetical protein